MPRHRVMLLVATTSVGLSLLGASLMAQQPTAARTGGPGVLGANLPALVTNPAVQAELNLTEGQKAQLKALGDKDEQQRLRWFERMGGKGPEGGDPAGQSGRLRGGGAARTGRAGRTGASSNGTARGRGLDDPPDPEQRDPFTTMLESRMKLQQSTERSIAGILSRAQHACARQIQLQVEGPGALLRSDMRERLSLDEDRVAQLRDLMQERQRALRETRDARRVLRQAALDRDPTLSRLNERLAAECPAIERPAYRKARNQAVRNSTRSREPEADGCVPGRGREDREAVPCALHSEILTR